MKEESGIMRTETPPETTATPSKAQEEVYRRTTDGTIMVGECIVSM